MKLVDLITKYPNAFRYTSPNHSFQLFGFECGDGWYSVIEPVVAYIEKLNAKEDRVYISQIKEKFGGLRFYVDGGDDRLCKLISDAEIKSESTCDVCGAVGSTVKVRSWLMTRCKDHLSDTTPL